jgi:presenilin-like A22 family membrane protease
MKHSLSITIVLLVAFLLAQLLGIAIIYNYIDLEQSLQSGKTEFKQLPIGERPPVDEGTSYLPMMIVIIAGTILMLVLIKYNLQWVWKGWFLLAVFMTLFVAFSALIPWSKIALFLALVLALWKVFKPNFWVQNVTELFIYGGLAAIFVPVFNLWSISILLVLISIYDAYAVWKSKHMIKLAQSQAKAKIFAGLLIPYSWNKKVPESKVASHLAEKKMDISATSTEKVSPAPKPHTAILGGGDIGFPLIFAGVILKEMGLWQSFIIPLFALIALAGLFFFAKEKKFYPAMPFISAGCFIGLGVVWLIGYLV